ncbi:MAG: aminopeptidase [Verrucomicrobia bacterium]|nr:aminopeptidase [Verrucomicrobiota bacterium]
MILDSRITKLAEGLTGFSTELKKGERVLIDAFDVPDSIVIALIRAARKLGALPYVQIHRSRVSRELSIGAEEAQFAPLAEVELARMQRMDAYIALRGSENIFEGSDIPSDKVQMVSRLMKPVLDHRVGKTKWVVLRWPTPAMAQQAGMSTDAFEEFYLQVCTLDYGRLTPGMAALKKLMDATDKVHIKGPGTDLRFSIRGIGSQPCGGLRNIPDGEVFSCPVKDSVEGVVQYNTPTVYLGSSFDNIRLVFKQGRIVEATSSNTPRLNDILNSDAGARYIGEFAIGFNPYILEPMRDILFDEKIAGSFHFTPGQAYDGVGNGNKSQVHWDMVCIQRPEYGGGEIWFDGKLIRKDGLFVPKALHKLNPDYLLGKED